jgi:restriction endonuclease S subunit
MAKWSIVKKSLTETYERLDPEYYDQKYDELEKLIEIHNMKRLGNEEIASLVTDGDHGNPEYSDESKGIHYIKSKELTSFGIDYGKGEKVTKEYAKKMSERCLLHDDDILLSTVGTIGVPSIASGDFPMSILSRDVARIVANKNNIIPKYLFLFLTTDFFQLQVEREISGSVQGGLYLHALKKLAIHKMSTTFQQEIKKIVDEMIELNLRSKKLRDIGKKAIDIGIKENEDEAIDFLKNAYDSS